MVGSSLADRFRDGMCRAATSVAVLTTDGAGGRAGVTVSTLCSLSLEPPSVIACVHKASQAVAAILANGVFAANVLADHQRHIAEIFAGRVEAYRDDRFACAEWSALGSGSPALKGALCSFDCRTASRFEFGSHAILVGEVAEVVVGNGRARPLIYADRAFRRLEAV